MAYAGKAGGSRSIRAVPNSPSNRSLASATAKSHPLGTLATGVAIGLLVGTAVGLLFAPQGGSETRRDIQRKFRRARRTGHDAWDDLRYELRSARKQLVNRALRRSQTEDLGNEPVGS